MPSPPANGRARRRAAVGLTGAALLLLLWLLLARTLWHSAGFTETRWQFRLHHLVSRRQGCHYYVSLAASDPPEWLKPDRYWKYSDGQSAGVSLWASARGSTLRLLGQLRIPDPPGSCPLLRLPRLG